MMNVIGLAGKPGCGKSAVARRLARRHRIEWIDLDRVAWEIYRSGTPAHRRLIERFGEKILDENGRIDRERLAEHAFGTANGRADLEAIVHPAIMEALLDKIAVARQRDVGILLVEGAVLLHSAHVDRAVFDHLVWLDASDGVRLERLRTAGRPDQVDRVPDPPVESFQGVDRLPADGTIGDVAARLLRLIGDCEDA